MEKLDLSKQFRAYYRAEKKPALLEIAEARYLAIDGKGDPEQQAFRENIQALYAVAYALKFNFKMRKQDFVVAKLEGLWWFDLSKYQGLVLSETPKIVARDEWRYRLLIRIPDFVEPRDVEEIRALVFQKKQLEIASQIEFYKLEEGKVVQILHEGPFDQEPETLRLVQEFMQANNLKQNGHHHEIYLSDFRTTTPEKLRTILREPVQ